VNVSAGRLRSLPRATLEALRAELGPRFVNAQQRAFFDSDAPEVLYSGAFRAGKSRIGCEKAYYLAKTYPGIPIGIFRKTAASLPASTERTLLVDVIPAGSIARSNAAQHWYELPNGSRIWLFGLDPDPITGVPSKVGSVELGWAFIDEAAECSEGDWVMVKGRLSWPGIPYHQLTAATNPAGPTHWLKSRFTPPSPSRVYLHASTFDNPALAADYLAEAHASPDDFYHRRYHLGEWVAAQGAIWNLPDDQVRAAGQTDWHHVFAGIDWGYQHAFACEVVGATGTGRLGVLGEIYEHRLTLDDLIPALTELQKRFRIEAFYGDPSEPAYIDACRAKGLNIRKAENAVLPGVTAVTAAIAAGMTVDPSCVGLLAEMPGYSWKPERGSGEMTDVPVKAHDDACDALRYAVMAHNAPEPGIIGLYRHLVAEATAKQTGSVAQVQPQRCGGRYLTLIDSIGRCGMPAGHAGRHGEGTGR
jgi:PBSX family phage terminase large subunit